MTTDADIRTKAGRVRDLFEQKWVEEQMRYYRSDSQKEPSRDEHEATLTGQADGAFDWVITMFDGFTGMSPEDCGAMKVLVDKVRDELRSSSAATTQTLAPLIVAWEGYAADTFEERFLTPFATARDNQIRLAEELGLAMHYLTEHIERTRQHVCGIADATARRLEALYVNGDTSNDDAKFWLAIAGAVATVAGAVMTGGTLAPALVAAGTAALSDAIYDRKVNGDTITAVANSLNQEITAAWGLINGFENPLGASLASDVAVVDAAIANEDQRRNLFPERTALDNGFDPAEFHP